MLANKGKGKGKEWRVKVGSRKVMWFTRTYVDACVFIEKQFENYHPKV